MTQILPPDYRPSRDEPFMNERQLEYFRLKLLAWHKELLQDSNNTRDQMESSDRPGADFADQASCATEQTFELHSRNRERKLIGKIEEALLRVEAGTYGYCSDSGKPIGLARLEARPMASLSIEAQGKHEEMESRGYRG